MMDITDLRKEIDAVDAQLAALLTERMDISKRIAVWKKENGRPALDTRREREKLAALTSAAREDMAQPLRVVYSLLFELSRAEQNTLLQPESQQLQMIRKAIAETPQLFPERAHVACQGVEGAYSTAACEKLFRAPEITYLKSFEGVFSAISSGLCDYGVLPIENSTAGSVKQVYDLLIANNCYIVRAARIKINHALLACPGATVDSIREIYSHEQALSQCQSHLEQLPNAMLHACSNTAAAAQMVAEMGRTDVAALASYHYAELYGLRCLLPDMQDNDNNHTRFICIAPRPEIYPGTNKTTLMLTVPHRPGALYKVLARLYCLGLNVQKLESRPIPNRDFEFLFYFDIESSIYSTDFERMISELEEVCEEVHYLGSYLEIV